MADKEFPLSIVLRTVDKATAGINAFNARLDKITKPIKDLNKATDALKENFAVLYKASGIGKVADGFAGVGGAVKDLLGKLLVVGGVAGGAVAGLVSIVGQFDDIGDFADRLGTSVDFLASMRYAAERSGATVEQLDGGLQTFSQSLGLARTGAGKMATFLKTISPALFEQVKASKTTEDAFMLLADAMTKIEDPAKRSAFALKTVGDPALVSLLQRGARGIGELQVDYINLAGSQEEAAASAGKVDDSMKDLKAATSGVKAALVTGLAPALKIVIDKMTEWLSGHREDIKRWAISIGEKLPGAIENVVSAVKGAIEWVSSFVDAIGGWKVAALAVAAVITGPLIASLVALGASLVATPFGVVLAGVAAITLAVLELKKGVEQVADALGLLQKLRDAGKTGETFGQGAGALMAQMSAARPKGLRELSAQSMNSLAPLAIGPRAQPRGLLEMSAASLAPVRDLIGVMPRGPIAAPAAQPSEANIKIAITGAPTGTRATIEPGSTANVDMTVGHQMGF